MPAVPSLKDSSVLGPVCPHAARLRVTNGNGDANGSSKVQEGLLQLPTKGGVRDKLEVEDVTGTIQAVGERKWIRPDLPSRCTWRLGGNHADSPHTHPQQ